MKKFQFALQTLLQHRRNLEEKERASFTRARAELLAEVAHGQELQVSQARTLAELAEQKLRHGNSQEISWYYLYLNRLAREMELSAGRVAELEKQVENRKQIMIEASRAKKMIENLRTKKAKEYVVAVEKNEQKAVDEMVVTRYALKQ